MAVSITRRVLADGKTVRYRAQVRVPGHPQALSKTFSRKRAAKDWARAEDDRLKALKPGSGGTRTVADAIERYRRERLPHLRTKRDRGRQLDVWERMIGSTRLCDVEPATITKCLEELANTKSERGKYLSGGTLNRYHSAISTVFAEAHKRWHWVGANPAREILRQPEAEPRRRWLRESERKALLQACEASTWPGLLCLVLLALGTGARRSELINLTWDQIDLERGLAHLETSKNREPRTLVIRGPALKELQAWEAKRRPGSALVFPGRTGRKPRCFDRPWRTAMKRAGLKDYTFHDCRHSFASYLSMCGADGLKMRPILGHRSIQSTDRYTHHSIEYQAKVVERMTREFFADDE